MTKRYKLTGGTEYLDEWSGQAGQSRRNVVYGALFAITDGSVFRSYGVLRDTQNPWEHFVLLREDLVLKVAFTEEDGFAIRYIGELEHAPGLDLAMDPR